MKKYENNILFFNFVLVSTVGILLLNEFYLKKHFFVENYIENVRVYYSNYTIGVQRFSSFSWFRNTIFIATERNFDRR